jgi:hypothetical protein
MVGKTRPYDRQNYTIALMDGDRVSVFIGYGGYENPPPVVVYWWD